MTQSAENAPVLAEDWCDHHPEWADNAGRCHHPDCTVVGRQVRKP